MIHARLTIFLTVLWASLFGAMASAQSIRVSSGEHPDFSRLVVAFRQKVDWSFGKVAGGFELRSNVESARFRLANVFELIPRDRIKSVLDLGGGRLFLEVSCVCYADVFELERGQVVLDIKDGIATADAEPFNQPLPSGTQGEMQVAEVSEPVPPREAEQPLVGAAEPGQPPAPERVARSAYEIRHGLPLLPGLSGLPNPQSETVEVMVAEDIPESAGVDPESELPDYPPLPTDSGSSERVREAEQELLVQISRGAAQGLLEAEVTVPILPEPEAPAEDIAESDGNEAPQPAETLPADPESHVLIQTSIDAQLPLADASATITEQGLQCPAEDAFAVPSWGGDIRSGADLAPYRSGLTGEFDAAQPEAILRLAKYYIYLTFGAEASALLERYAGELGDVTNLQILADIMSAHSSPSAGAMAPLVECGGSTALWAVLAQDRPDPAFPINEAAVLTAFSELPMHLRRYLGPVLANRLIDAGQADLAHALRNALARGETGNSPGLTYVEARLAMDEGAIDQAAGMLETLLQENAEASPEVMRDLLELKLEQDLAITESEIALVSSFAFEQRGTEMGEVLRALEIRALGHSGRFNEAFERLQEFENRGELPEETRRDLKIDLAGYLATKGTDAQFLRYLSPMAPAIRLPGEIRTVVAERFLETGFLPEARAVLSSSATIPGHAERRLLARLAIKEGKFNVALGYLAGLDDSESGALRAQAYAGRNDIPAALAAFEQIGETEKLLELAWRAGQWEEIAARDAGQMGRASALLLETPEPSAPAGGTENVLAVDAQMLARSIQSRKTISDLLVRFPSL